MRLASILLEGRAQLAIDTSAGSLPMQAVNTAFGTRWPTSLADVVETGRVGDLAAWYRTLGVDEFDRHARLAIDRRQVVYQPPYRTPPKIWGIGLNYREHAADLSEQAPTSAPARFMKPATTIIGPGDAIQIPALSWRTTAEAELGVVIGRRCKDVPPENWLDVVAGFTTILDMTAEDILQENPRFLTRSKSFDTFFAFGPQVITPDEVGDVNRLEVATIINGAVHAANTVSQMTFTPDRLVADHSQVMTLLPGDIISTGTPGAAVIGHNDTVACRISGFETLVNPVIDLKVPKDGS